MGLKTKFVVAFSGLSLTIVTVGCGGVEEPEALPMFGQDPTGGSTQEQKKTTPAPSPSTNATPAATQKPDSRAPTQSTAAACPSGYPNLLQTFAHLQDIVKAGKCDATCVTATHCCFEPDLGGAAPAVGGKCIPRDFK